MENPLKYLKSILDKDISFFDYKKMDRGSWASYFNDAQMIVKNETFLNELKHFQKDLMEKAFLDTTDFQQIMHLRTAFITLETLLQRLESIENPNREVLNTDEYAGI